MLYCDHHNLITSQLKACTRHSIIINVLLIIEKKLHNYTTRKIVVMYIYK